MFGAPVVVEKGQVVVGPIVELPIAVQTAGPPSVEPTVVLRLPIVLIVVPLPGVELTVPNVVQIVEQQGAVLTAEQRDAERTAVLSVAQTAELHIVELDVEKLIEIAKQMFALIVVLHFEAHYSSIVELVVLVSAVRELQQQQFVHHPLMFQSH